jgi:hypothetical protein
MTVTMTRQLTQQARSGVYVFTGNAAHVSTVGETPAPPINSSDFVLWAPPLWAQLHDFFPQFADDLWDVGWNRKELIWIVCPCQREHWERLFPPEDPGFYSVEFVENEAVWITFRLTCVLDESVVTHLMSFCTRRGGK